MVSMRTERAGFQGILRIRSSAGQPLDSIAQVQLQVQVQLYMQCMKRAKQEE